MASRKTNFLCTLVTGCQHIHSSPRLMSTGHLRGGGGGGKAVDIRAGQIHKWLLCTSDPGFDL